MKKILGIGWDVGGWMGRKHAFAALMMREDGYWEWLCCHEGISLKEQGFLTFRDLLQRVQAEAYEESRIVLAMDAPLGFPRAFIQMVNGMQIDMPYPEQEILNPLAYRETDRYIYEMFKKKPLSATFDKLGTVAALAIIQARFLIEEGKFSLQPNFEVVEGKRSIIEVYPALLKQKKLPLQPWFYEMLPSLSGRGEDARDAILASVYAVAYGSQGLFGPFPSLQGPCTNDPVYQEEGWIYHFPRNSTIYQEGDLPFHQEI